MRRHLRTLLCALVVAGGSCPAQESPPAGTTTADAQATRTREPLPTRADATALIQALDDDFNGGRVEDLLDKFDEHGHACFRGVLANRVRRLASRPGMRSKSEVTGFFLRGRTGIALARTVYSLQDWSYESWAYTAFERRGGKSIALFRVEVDPAGAARMRADRGRFACPACNYSIRFDDDWLAVPLRASQSSCMESLWLISLRDDLHIEAAVHVGEQEKPAAAAMRALLASERAALQVREVGLLDSSDWRPPAYGSGPLPAGMTARRCVRHCKSGLVAELNLIVVGRLRYLIVVRGDERVLARRRAAIDKVLRDFRLLDPQLTAAKMARQATLVHTGGGILDEDNLYRSTRYHLALAGPKGWRGRVRAGGFLFRLDFDCPNTSGHLLVVAIGKRGRPWTRATAESWMRKSCKKGAPVREGPGNECREAGGFHWGRVESGEPDRVVCYAWRPDILLIFESDVPNASVRKLVDAAMASLRTIE